MDHRKLFAKRVRRLREAANLSLAEAGEKGDITGNFWGDVERCKKVPSLDTIVAMARGLNVPPSVLLMLDREEDDERALRKRIETILDKSDAKQLKRFYCYMIDTVAR